MSADPITLFDRRAWRLHRDRAARTGCVDFLHAEVADRLVDRLDNLGRQFATALDLGAHNGALSRAIARRSEIEQVFRLELAIADISKQIRNACLIYWYSLAREWSDRNARQSNAAN